MEKNIKTASKGVRSMYEWLEEIVFALVAVILVFTFLFRVVTVTGKSMLPNFVEGEKVVVTNLGHDIEQGTVVVVTNVLEEPIIKRVIATEGQTVNIDYDTGTVYIDGEALNETQFGIENGITFHPYDGYEALVFPQTVPKAACSFWAITAPYQGQPLCGDRHDRHAPYHGRSRVHALPVRSLRFCENE